jgi:hypothetical protein
MILNWSMKACSKTYATVRIAILRIDHQAVGFVDELDFAGIAD